MSHLKATDKKKISEMFSTIEEWKAKLEDIASELQESYDSKSEKWQESEKGDAAQTEINNVESVVSDFENTMVTLGDLFQEE